MAKARKQKLKKPLSTPSPGRRRLKVFKTPIGFHDAYVAAPSRKAALEAWGAGTDLFSAGIAEEVKSPTGNAAKAALSRPGEVVREARQGEKEGRPSTMRGAHHSPNGAGSRTSGRTQKRAPAKLTPRPSRAALDRAEAALAELEERQALERAELAKEEEKLARKRRALEDRQAKAREQAEAKRDAVEERYREAMRGWAG